jgi:hypothetical protein
MSYEEMVPPTKPGKRRACRITDPERLNHMGLKRLLTKCTLVIANGETSDKLGILHVHTWPWSDRVREVLFEPPRGHGAAFPVSPDTMRQALDEENWADVVSLFYQARLAE